MSVVSFEVCLLQFVKSISNLFMSANLYIRLVCAVKIARLQPRQVAKFLFYPSLRSERSSIQTLD